MADIQIVYREGHCRYNQRDYNTQCHTLAADFGCKYFCKHEDGYCDRAEFIYIYKGWTGKRYKLEEVRDPYNPWLDRMDVTLGNRTYDCVKVTLDGKCIFNEFDTEQKTAGTNEIPLKW